MTHEEAPESTETAQGREEAPEATPDATGAGEALVQQIADKIEEAAEQVGIEDFDHNDALMLAENVLPLVEAQVAPLRERLAREHVPCARALMLEEERRILADREATVAESALRQVREDVNRVRMTLAGIWESVTDECDLLDPSNVCHGFDFTDEGDCALATDLNGIEKALRKAVERPDSARVGAADTQPEGAGEALRRIRALLAMREENDVRDEDGFAVVRVDDVRAMFPPHACEGDGTCIHCGADEPPAWPTDTPTAGSNGDTAPEADLMRCDNCGTPEADFPGLPESATCCGKGCFHSPADTAPEAGEAGHHWPNCDDGAKCGGPHCPPRDDEGGE